MPRLNLPVKARSEGEVSCSGKPRPFPTSRPGFRQFLFLAGIGIFGALLEAAAQEGPKGDSGVFEIRSAERRVGTESFKIIPSGSGWEATGELQLEAAGGPEILESCTLRLNTGFYPTAYERRQKSPKKGEIVAQFEPSQTTLVSRTEEGDQEQVFFLPQDHLAVLDTNFFHHYWLLLRQYDSAQAGAQPFNIFIPQEATPGTLSLELQGKENEVPGGVKREVNHFQLTTEELKIEIWATPEGEIERIWIPQAGLEVVRQHTR